MTPIDTGFAARQPDRRVFLLFPLSVLGMAMLLIWWIFGADDSPQGPAVLTLASGSLIAAEGDSLTYGLDHGGINFPINDAGANRSPRPWPEVLAQRLGADVTVANRGYPGDRLRDTAKRWAEQPIGHLTLAQFGLNDALNLSRAEDGGLPLGDFRDQLVAYVSLRQSMGMQVMLITPPPVADPALEATLAPYRAAVVAVGKDLGVIVIDTATAIKDIAQPHTADGIHLTAEANTAIAATIATRLTVD